MRIKRVYVKKHYIGLRDIDCVFPIPGIARHQCGIGLSDRTPNIVVPSEIVYQNHTVYRCSWRPHAHLLIE